MTDLKNNHKLKEYIQYANPTNFCLIMKQTQTVRSMIIMSFWDFSNFTAFLVTQIPPYMYCTSTATSKKGSRPTAVMSLVCGTEYCFFPLFLMIYRLIYKGCLLHATMSLQDSVCTSECSFRIRNSKKTNQKKKHLCPIGVIMYQREVKKLNSNLIASSHSLHFNSATVVQKDKGRLCFSAVLKTKKTKTKENWCCRGPFHQ